MNKRRNVVVVGKNVKGNVFEETVSIDGVGKGNSILEGDNVGWGVERKSTIGCKGGAGNQGKYVRAGNVGLEYLSMGEERGFGIGPAAGRLRRGVEK